MLGQVGEPALVEEVVEGALHPLRGRRVGLPQPEQDLWYEWVARHPHTVSIPA